MLPIVVITIVSIYSQTIKNIFPSLAIQDCFIRDDYVVHINYTLEVILVFNFAQNLFFIMSIYLLRHVQDEFSMNPELKFVVAVWFITGLLTYFFVLLLPRNSFVHTGSV